MSLIPRITTENTDNQQIKDTFAMFEQALGAIPEPLRLIANSPGLFALQVGQLGYYRDHEKLSPELLAMIRFTSATFFENTACIEFNSALLKKQGMTESELAKIVTEPIQAPLEKNEHALLSFVVKAIKDQTSATPEEISDLQDLGWRDSDIVDAVNHGFLMFAPGKMLKLFDMM